MFPISRKLSILLCFVICTGVFIVSNQKAAFRDIHAAKNQASIPFNLIEIKKEAALTENRPATQPPVETTTTKSPRVNPLLELKNSNTRVSSLPRERIVRRLEGTIQSQITSPPSSMEPVPSIMPSASSVVLSQSVSTPTTLPSVCTTERIVADSIRRSGVWEYESIYYIWATLVQDPDMHFIDMGTNIGAMTLVVAKLGRKVVAVEPLKATLSLLCKSVIANNVTDKVTIVPYALSDQRTTFKSLTARNNWGGTWLVKNHSSDLYSEVVTTILTDDLLNFITFDKAFLKIDIEGFEPAALRSATKLFDKVSIPVIMMEWGRMREQIAGGDTNSLSLLDFLYSRGYSAYTERGEKLARSGHTSWGENIHWVHDNFIFEVDPWSVY